MHLYLAMKYSSLIIERIKAELSIRLPRGARCERTRYGRNQLAIGAWSWRIVDGKGGLTRFGSPCHMRDIATAEKIYAHSPRYTNDVEFWPYIECT